MTDLVPVPSNGQLLIGNGSAFVNSTLTAGTGISISNGAGSITINATDGNITLDDGSAAAPSLNFTNEPTTGLFRASANVMGFAVNGTSRATMTTTGLTVAGTITPTGSVHAAAGSVGNPSLAFNSDQDTGLFSIGANNIGVAVGGAKVLDVASTGLTVTGALGAASLTSPAANNLTLGTVSFGTALTVASATGNVGIGTITPAQKLSVNGTIQWAQTSDAGYSGYLTNASTNAAYNPAITRNLIGSTGSTYTIAHGDMGAYAGIQFGISGTSTNAGNISFFAASGSFATNDSVTPVARMFIANTGDVTISSTTAGSSGAGALLVQGGISAGNTGNAASYFGGAVTAAGTLRATNGNLYTYGESGDATSGILFFNSAANNYIYGSGSQLAIYTAGVQRATISSTAATFAGAVAIGNTVNTVSPTSPNRTITMVVNGVTLYLAAKTTND